LGSLARHTKRPRGKGAFDCSVRIVEKLTVIKAATGFSIVISAVNPQPRTFSARSEQMEPS
jgi:hypothetical protein